MLSSFPLPQRGILGQQAQFKLQKQRETSQGLFHRELHIRQSLKYCGYIFEIQGRIDGLYELPGQIDIEEIKSVILNSKDFSKLDIDDYPEYSEQVFIYSYLVHLEKPGIHIQPLLVLVNLVNDKSRSFRLPFDSIEVKTMIHQRFSHIIEVMKYEEENYRQRLRKLSGVDFALSEKRPQQEEMMEAVNKSLKAGSHLLASAPTGTGKTAAALFPAIRYALENKKKLIYLTPKTTQQAVIRDTLEPLINQGLDLKVCFLRASRKMCANDIFFCHEDYCPYAKDYDLKSLKLNLLDDLLREKLIYPEVVFESARTAGICPAETLLDLATRADMIIGDYNYVFDPAVQLRHIFQQNDLSDWIMIIDEAHNLFQRSADTLSPQIRRVTVTDLKKNIINDRLKVYRDLKTALIQTEQLMDALQQEGEIRHRFQQYYETSLDSLQWKKALRDYEASFIKYLIFKIRKRLLILDDPFESFYYTLRNFVRIAALEGHEFISFYNADQGGILKIQCCDPSLHTGQIIDKFHSVIAMSATLDPVHYYQDILGFPPDKTELLEVTSPFSNRNRQIIILPNIPTYYKDRPRSYPLYANVVKDIIRLKKGNYIVFCPSYEFLQNLSIFLGELPSDLILQRQKMTEAERSELLRRMKNESSPQLLLAVMGGIFSEGIDLRGDSCIGVIIFSPAIPKVTYERELIRNYYEEIRGEGTRYAYLFPGLNKVIQSVGRLIRSSQDKGIIVLAGERFAQEEVNQFLPLYWFEKSGDVVITDDYKKHIREFWKRFE
jgi:Rad3-related DNA helicase